MSKQKVTLRIEEGEVELLKLLFNTDNQSEAIRLAILQSLATEDSEKLKTLFPYIGKKPPRIGREVVNAFEQSGCKIFVDLFLDIKITPFTSSGAVTRIIIKILM